MNVFISYARDAGVAADIIADEIVLRGGVRVFMDVTAPIGERWDEVVFDAINEADAVIVLLSDDYFKSSWCQAELAESFRAEKRILPVMVRPCQVDEGPLQYLQYLDLTDSFQRGVNSLIEAVYG